MKNELKNIKKYAKKFEKANLMEDLKFQQVAKSKEAVEEILRVVLSDKKLKVISTIPQRNRRNCLFHGVIIDCECKISSGEIVHIEVQISSSDNAIYRVRYNQSVITVENSPKSKDFKYKDIPKLISIMFCDFDIFKKNKPIYEVIRLEKNTNAPADNGIREIYVNVRAKVTDKALSNLFKILTDVKYSNEEYYPNLSKRKEEVNKLIIGGTNKMSGLSKEIFRDGKKEGLEEGIQKGIQKGMQKGAISIIVKAVKDGLMTLANAAKSLNMSEKELQKLVNA